MEKIVGGMSLYREIFGGWVHEPGYAVAAQYLLHSLFRNEDMILS